MAQKVKLTRPELKRQRDALKRYTRYLPMLKLRQSQLQMQYNRSRSELDQARAAVETERERCASFRPVLADVGGVNLETATTPVETRTHEEDVAGIGVPVLDEVVFDVIHYSLFGTPVWVDGAIKRLRDLRRAEVAMQVLEQQVRLIHVELKKTIQRVNLFEQVKIPESKEIVRRIRIRLGDEMTSAIGRSKIAKGKLAALADAPTAGEDAL